MKVLEIAATVSAIKTVDDLPDNDARQLMTHEEWVGWFKEEFKRGAQFAQRWIPVEESVPDRPIKVLIKGTVIGSLESRITLGKRVQGTWWADVDCVTHWRPIELL